jgi:fucose permease
MRQTATAMSLSNAPSEQRTRPSDRDRRARLAVAAMFVVNGSYFGTWAARIPAIEAQLALSAADLGIALLAIAAGAVFIMPLVGRLAAQHGSRPGMIAGVVLMTVTLPLAAIMPNLLTLVVMLALLGVGSGFLDISMNAHGLVVERRYGRPILSSFHGVWSVGGLAGAALGALFAGAGLPPVVHFTIVAVIVGCLGLVATRWLLPRDVDRVDEPAPLRLPPRPIAMLGILAFGGLLAEGAVGDWSALYMTRSLGTDEATGALGFAAFALFMTVGRFGGDWLVERLGPVAMMRAGGVLAAGGIAVAIAVGHPVAAIVGFAAAGLGLASLVPLVFRAGGSHPSVPSGVGIAGVATVGYTGFLAGPPAVGFAAQAFSLPVALWIVVALAAMLAVFAGFVAPVSADTTDGAPQPRPADLRAVR